MKTLDEARLTYPRVSEIIGKQSDELKGIPLETLANACIRGQKVHDYCTAWAKNLWVSDIELEYEPYVNAFTKWAEEHLEEVKFSSVRLYDDKMRFTGEFDMIIKMKRTNQLVLLDIKTSANKSKSWPVQLSAYAHLCKVNGYHFDSIMNIHLKKTHAALYEENEGKKVMTSPPQVKACAIEHEDINSHWDIFSSALKCYDYFTRKETK